MHLFVLEWYFDHFTNENPKFTWNCYLNMLLKGETLESWKRGCLFSVSACMFAGWCRSHWRGRPPSPRRPGPRTPEAPPADLKQGHYASRGLRCPDLWLVVLTVDGQINLPLESPVFERPMLGHTPDLCAVIPRAGSEFESVYRVPGSLPDALGDLVRVLWK